MSRQYLNPVPDLPADLASLDARLADAYLAERLVLPAGVAAQAMIRLPLPASGVVRAARWGSAAVLFVTLFGMMMFYRVLVDAPVWTAEDKIGYGAGALALALAAALNLAAPRIALWMRAISARAGSVSSAPLTGEVLALRAAALVLLAGVWMALR